MSKNTQQRAAWTPEKRLNKQIGLYILFALLFTWPFTIIGSIAHLNVNKYPMVYLAPLFAVALTIYMTGQSKIGYAPSCAGSGIKFIIKPKEGYKFYLYAVLIPLLFTFLGAVLFFVVKPGTFSAVLIRYKASKVGASVATYIFKYVLITTLMQVFFNSAIALGETIGWVGFLMPRLNEKFNTQKGSLLAGILAGVWTWPVLWYQWQKIPVTITSPTGETLKTYSGYLYGLEYPAAPYSGMLAVLVYCFAIGVVLWWLYNKTESLLCCTLMFGSFKTFGTLALTFRDLGIVQNNFLFGPSLPGLISVIPLLVFAIYLLLKHKEELGFTLNIKEVDKA